MKYGSRWDNLGEITVKTYDGKQEVFPDLESAVESLYFSSYYRADVVQYGYLKYYSNRPEWREWYGGPGDTKAFFTSEGLMIPVWKVMEVWRTQPHTSRRDNRWYYRRRNKFKFRDGSVEGIRCWKPGRYRGYRHIQTHQEIRENDFLDNYDEDAIEYKVKARGRRRRHNLPTPWDDIRCHSYGRKNWKHFRKHQWKE